MCSHSVHRNVICCALVFGGILNVLCLRLKVLLLLRVRIPPCYAPHPCQGLGRVFGVAEEPFTALPHCPWRVLPEHVRRTQVQEVPWTHAHGRSSGLLIRHACAHTHVVRAMQFAAEAKLGPTCEGCVHGVYGFRVGFCACRLEEQDAGSKDLFRRFDPRLADAAAAAKVCPPRHLHASYAACLECGRN